MEKVKYFNVLPVRKDFLNFMLNRKIENEIIDFLDNYNMALLVEGARQVGKTTSIRNALKKGNFDFVEFNLIRDKEFLNALKLDEQMGPEEFIKTLTVYTNHKFIKGETVIFIDEVQLCSELITKSKFLVQEGSFKYVFSGSMLGIELNNLRSAPVGYMGIKRMYPLDFEEFACAVRINKDSLEYIHDHFKKSQPLNPGIHSMLMNVFKDYLIVGGMPRVVQEYIDSNNYNNVRKIQKYIISLYKKDFTQYENYDKKLKLMATYDAVPSELNAKNKRFIIANIEKGLKFTRQESTFEWLCAAGVTIPVYNVTVPTYPLSINKKSNLMKLFLNDVGLLTCCYGKGTIIKILNNDDDVNFGAVYENYIAQELFAHGYDTYYYNSKKFGEVDFIIENGASALPIEVKSGKDYTKHNALNNIMSNKNYNIDNAYLFSNENISQLNVATMQKNDNTVDFKDEYTVTYLPMYMTMFLDPEKIILPNSDASKSDKLNALVANQNK